MASDPASPMKTCAGYALNHRNPMAAPTNAAHTTTSSPTPGKNGKKR